MAGRIECPEMWNSSTPVCIPAWNQETPIKVNTLFTLYEYWKPILLHILHAVLIGRNNGNGEALRHVYSITNNKHLTPFTTKVDGQKSTTIKEITH